jgi:hypothetical protein
VVDITLNEAGGSLVLVKLQTETWELNIEASTAELVRLHGIEDADWDARHSLAIGTCAGASVYWAMSGGRATILIGHDDETWDIGLQIPVATVHEIASLAERLL